MDEVFVISRIIEDEVGVISRSRRPRLITLTETSIILDITKTESNNCFIIHWTEKLKSCFCFFTNGKQHKAREVDMITLRNHAPRSYMTWLPVTLSVLDIDSCIICSYDVTGADFENSPYAFGQSEKRERVQCIIKIICSNNRSRWNKTKKTKKLSRRNTKSKGQLSKILAKTNHELLVLRNNR